MGCEIAAALGISCDGCSGSSNVCPEMRIDGNQARAASRQNDSRYAFSLSDVGQRDAQETEKVFLDKISKTLRIAPVIRARQARAIFLAKKAEAEATQVC